MVSPFHQPPRSLARVQTDALDRLQGRRRPLPKTKATLADVVARLDETNLLLRALVSRMGGRVDSVRHQHLSHCGGSRPTVEAVLELAENTFGYRLEELRGPDRTEAIAYARHVAMWALRRRTDLSSTVIGRLFDRDHGTVLHAVRRIEDQMTLPGERTRAVTEAFLQQLDEVTE